MGSGQENGRGPERMGERPGGEWEGSGKEVRQGKGGKGPPPPGHLTFAPIPLEVHVAPLAIIDLAARRPQLDAPRAHVQQEVEVAIQQLHGEVVSPLGRAVAASPSPSPPALAEK